MEVNMIPAVVCVGNENHSNIAPLWNSCYSFFEPESVWAPIQNARDSTLSLNMDSIKCCNECDSCKTPKPNLGYCINKLSTPYYASPVNPSQPSMASLLAKAWKAKRMAMTRKGLTSHVAPLTTALGAPQPVKRKAQERFAPLLSKRLGKNVSMTVEIPRRNPFPAPLVWNPPSS